MNKQRVYLHAVTSHVPEKSYSQEEILEVMIRLLGDSPEKIDLLTRIYRGAAIDKRHTVISDFHKIPSKNDFYSGKPEFIAESSTKARNDLYIREANKLSLKVVQKLFDRLPGLKYQDITHLITVSCTGFSTPGFDFHIIRELPLRPTINRFHIGFMGCFAAFPALKLARNICLSEPDARVLVVNLELCSLHFQQSIDLDVIIANSLFADGVTAALVSGFENDSRANRLLLHDFFSKIVPGSEDTMAWTIGDKGFDIRLSAYIPQILDENILDVMHDFKERTGIDKDRVDLWAIHPGGRGILDKLWKTLALSKEQFSASYGVLKDYGNMSSATIMFVLERLLADKDYGTVFSAAFGPGLTMETGYMEKI